MLEAGAEAIVRSTAFCSIGAVCASRSPTKGITPLPMGSASEELTRMFTPELWHSAAVPREEIRSRIYWGGPARAEPTMTEGCPMGRDPRIAAVAGNGASTTTTTSPATH